MISVQRPDAVVLSLYGPGLLAGLAVATLAAALSPLVVLKRLSFIGQGISHAAFGAVGLAALAGFSWGTGEVAPLVIVLLFCLVAGVMIASLTRRSTSEADAAVGIVLVGSMALGAILLEIARRIHARPPAAWEGLLFGSILSVGWRDAAIAWIITAALLAVLWWTRRPLLFWAFDEEAAPAFGVNGPAMKHLLVALLTMAIVAAMKLAGVVLATAMLVLPGATALCLSDRSAAAGGLSLAAGITGVVIGLGISYILPHLPPGACIVATLVCLFAIASVLARRRRSPPAPASAPPPHPDMSRSTP